jgi:large subunit ribosomal protein L7Ae
LLTRLNDQPKAKPGSGKKPAAAPFASNKAAKTKKNPIFEATPKNFGIGATHALRILDLIFVRW